MLLHPDLHWLFVPEQIRFRLFVLMHRCLNDTALPYLAEGIRQAAGVDGRCHLCNLTASLVQGQVLCDLLIICCELFLSLHVVTVSCR